LHLIVVIFQAPKPKKLADIFLIRTGGFSQLGSLNISISYETSLSKELFFKSTFVVNYSNKEIISNIHFYFRNFPSLLGAFKNLVFIRLGKVN
jgi:hypothetical protein